MENMDDKSTQGNDMKNRARTTRSPVATEAEGVVLFPGGYPGRVVVTAALAETTVLRTFSRTISTL